jgi:hypothetical protein
LPFWAKIAQNGIVRTNLHRVLNPMKVARAFQTIFAQNANTGQAYRHHFCTIDRMKVLLWFVEAKALKTSCLLIECAHFQKVF